MGRFQSGLKKGPWTPEEDKKLFSFIEKHGVRNWGTLPKLAGLNRSRQSCRSRWMNYLRPNIKRGSFSEEEERIIVALFVSIGSRWSIIAAQLPGRTDNEVKNFWNTHLKKKLLRIAPYQKLSKERTDCDEIKNFHNFGGPKGSSSHLAVQRESQFLEHNLESSVQEVGSPFLSFSSAQPDYPQTVPEQGHDIWGDLHTFVGWEGCQTQCMILMDQKLYSDSAHNPTSTAHHDEAMHAAAIRIQNKFCSWKGRKDFLIIRQRIIKLQAHVRGHQVRKNYKKIVWSVGILEKFFLRWRQKASSLCGFKSEAVTKGGSSMLDTSLERSDFDFLNEGRKQKEEARLQTALARVKSIVQYPEGRDQCPFNDTTVEDNYPGKFSVVPRTDFMSLAKADNSWVLNDAGLTYEPQKNLDFWSSEDALQNCPQGVGSQTFPLFSSNQPDNLGNIPKQGPKILGKLSTISNGECKEFGTCLQIQGESQGMTSTQFANVASESVMDYTNEFTSDKIFKSKEELIQWTRNIGRKNGFVIVIKRSDLGSGGGQKARISFCCERGGQYRNKGKNKENKKEKQLRNVATKKCGCPFTLKGRKFGSDDNWMLEVVCRVHNHPISKPIEGRSYAGRLSKTETLLLIDMSKSMARPRDILVTLKDRDVDNASTIKQIYNARQRHNKLIKIPERSQIQQLLRKLSEHKYVEWHRSFDNSKIIKDLFWAHPVSINLLHAFPRVLVMDTCKTNRYNLLLLVIKGVTSTNMTFVVALAYLESEQEDNYIWALERLRSVMDDNALPTVIISDKELAVMNAIARVFPTTKHLLSRWHIARNVLTNCKKLFAINEIWEKFRMSWNLVVLSSNEDEFTDRLNTLKKDFISYPEAIEYVMNTWLNNYKEQFVSAWTDKIMHFGNLTRNRVGSSHSMLKKHLRFGHCNFETSWGKIHSLLELQHTNIRASFDRSLKVVQDQFKTAEFEELQGFISTDALHMILSELKRAHSIGVDAHACGCIIRLTHGLPCAHEIAEFKRESRPIPLESIDSYWRMLDLVPISKKQKINSSCEPVFDLIAECFDEVDDDTKLHILKKLTEIANAEFPLIETEAKKEIHGRPNSKGLSMIPTAQVKKKRQSKATVHTNKRLKSNKFARFFPVGLLPYIHHIKDVVADGNCGFRAVADLMGFGEDGWLQVRKDLLNELNSNLEYYSLLYGTGETDERVKELIHALTYFESCPRRDRWMIMPDMGHLIASAYNIVLFHLSFQQCLTFLPLRSMPMPTNYRKDIAVGYVNNNHFVEVFLSVDHPVPPITTNWYKFRHACAEGWETVYTSRIEHFREVIGNNVATDEIIIDSSSDD